MYLSWETPQQFARLIEHHLVGGASPAVGYAIPTFACESEFRVPKFGPSLKRKRIYTGIFRFVILYLNIFLAVARWSLASKFCSIKDKPYILGGILTF